MMNALPSNTIIKRLQWVHSILNGGQNGVVFEINGEQKPGTVGSLLDGALKTGGNAYFRIVFKKGHISHIPEAIIRGVQWRILDEFATEEDLQALLENVELVKKQNEEKARLEGIARKEEREKIIRDYPYLTRIDQAPGTSSWSLGAKNIRVELKKAFPGVKFTVTSDSYSGGCSIRVKWEDGPTRDQVLTISDKYQELSFNGMDDSTSVRDSVWPGVYGGANYVLETRSYSPTFIQSTIEELGFTAKATVDQNGYLRCETGREHDWIYREMAKTSLYVPPAKTEIEQAPKVEGVVKEVSITVNTEKNGIEIRFPVKPIASILAKLNLNRWRWSRVNNLWYSRNTEENMTFAQSIVHEFMQSQENFESAEAAHTMLV